MSETDSDGFPAATAENAGTLYTDEFNVTYVCDKATPEEREEYDADLNIVGDVYVWRQMGRS